MAEEKKDKPISPGLQQALLAGLPTLVGAIFGGSEGTAIGADVGVKALNQQQSLAADIAKEKRRQEFELKKQTIKNQTDISSFIKKEQIKDLFQQFDPQTPQQKAKLKHSKDELEHKRKVEDRQKKGEARRALREERNFNESADSQVLQFKKFHKDQFDQVKTLNSFLDILKDPNARASSGMINNFSARNINEEVGALSKSDLEAAGIPLSLREKIKNFPNEFFTGNITPEVREQTIKIFQLANKAKKSQLRELARQRSNRFDERFSKEKGTFGDIIIKEHGLQEGLSIEQKRQLVREKLKNQQGKINVK